MNAIAQAATAFCEHRRRQERIIHEATILMRSELAELREQAAKVPVLQVTINDLHCEIRGLRRQIVEERRRAAVAALVGLLTLAWMAV